MKLGKIAVVATVVAAGLIAPTPARATEPPRDPHRDRVRRRGLHGRPHRHRGRRSTCCAAAATRSTPPSRPRPRSASPSRSPPASAAAASSSTTTPRTERVHTIDGRESAPGLDDRGRASSTRPTGCRTTFPEARVSGLSVGVPGTLRDLGGRRCASGARRSLGSLLRPARPGRRARLHGRRDVPPAGRRQRRRVRPVRVDQRRSTCPAARRRRSARRCATPTSPTPTG